MVNINVCVGAAGFALGLSLAGLGAAGVASADSPKTDAARADSTAASAGPTRQASKATKRMTARGGTIPARPSAAATRRPASAFALPSTSDRTSNPPAVPVGEVAATAPVVPLPTDAVPRVIRQPTPWGGPVTRCPTPVPRTPEEEEAHWHSLWFDVRDQIDRGDHGYEDSVDDEDAATAPCMHCHPSARKAA